MVSASAVVSPVNVPFKRKDVVSRETLGVPTMLAAENTLLKVVPTVTKLP